MNYWARWLAAHPATLQRLIARTHRVSLPRHADADARTARLRAALCNAAAVRALFFALPLNCRDGLQLLRSAPHGFTPAELVARLGPLRPLAALRADPRPRSVAERLLLAGLLFFRPATPQHPARYRLPPELRRWLPRPLPAHGSASSQLDACDAPIAATVAAVVLLAAAEAPLALQRSGLPRAATLRALAQHLDPATPDQAALITWVFALLHKRGLLACHDDRAVTTAAAAGFLRRSPADRALLLRAAWLATVRPDACLALPPRARATIDWPALQRRLLAWTAALPTGQPLAAASLYDDLAAAFGPLSAGLAPAGRRGRPTPWNKPRSAAVWRSALAGPLHWLGFVALTTPTADGTPRFVATSYAATALDGSPTATHCPAPAQTPGPEDYADELQREQVRPVAPWTLDAQGCITIALSDLDDETLRLLPFARWERTAAQHCLFRIDTITLAAADAAGRPRPVLRSLIERHAGPLPTAWANLLADPTEAVRIIHAAVAVATTPQLLDQAARQRSVRRHIADHLAPGVALVEPDAAPALSRALGQSGVAVNIVGEPTVAPPSELTSGECELLLAACAHYREHGTAPAAALDLLVARLEAGLPATRRPAPASPGEPAAPPPSEALCSPPAVMPADPVGLLRDAISRRLAVTILYQSAQAERPTSRTVRPLRLELAGELWYLSAFCLVTQQELTFRLDRMHALAMLPRRSSVAPQSGSRSPRRRAPTVRAPRPSAPGRGAWLEP